MKPILWCIGCAVAATLSACGAARPPAIPAAAPSASAATHARPARIAQLTSTAPVGRSGQAAEDRLAEFVLCLDSVCPQTTPKTLAVDRPLPAAAPPSPPAEAAAIPQAAIHTTAEADAATIASTAPAFLAARIEPGVGRAADLAVTVHFQFGDADLTPTARTLLDEVAVQVDTAGQLRRLRIVGRTDSVGSKVVNDALARARADAARVHLRKRLQRWPDAINVEATGACCYAASNATVQGRRANRRVEVTFSSAELETPL